MRLDSRVGMSAVAVAFCVACLLLASRSVNAQDLITSIRQQLDLAREFDPDYAAAVADLEAAKHGLSVAQAGLGPQVTLSASTFRSDRKEEADTISGSTEVQTRINSHVAQIQARQPLYRKRTEMEIGQARAELEAAQELLQAADQDLQGRVLSSWLEILAVRDQVSVQEKAVIASREAFFQSDRSRSAGESARQDVEIAQAQLMQDQALLEDLQAQLEIANQKLRNIAGPRAAVQDSARLQKLSGLLVRRRHGQELVDLIQKNNFEVRASRAQEEAARFKREKVRADKYPTMDAYALASKGDNDAVSTIKDEQRIGLQLSVPLYTSGAINAGVAQADANYRRAQARTRAIALKAESDAVSANIRLIALTKRLSAAQKTVEAAELMLRATGMGVRSGVNSRAEVATALQELAVAQRQLIQLRSEYLSSWLMVEKALCALSIHQLENIQHLLQ